jgi:phospholipid/cholesterol/gamma-HCH transport system substrate-binding protein
MTSPLVVSLKFVAFTLACLLALAWLVTMIGNVSWFASRASYEAVVADVGGLVVNDDVKIAGVQVGKVDAIEVERGNAVVTFSVDDDVVLGEDTVVAVRWKNALGLRILELQTAGDGQLPEGHRFDLQATRTPADLDLLLARANPMLQAIDTDLSNQLVRELNRALDGREGDLRQLVVDAAEVLDVVASRDEAISRALRDGATLADAYVQRRETLDRLLAEAADLGEGLSQRTDVLVDAVTALADAQGELDRLVDENDETLRALLADVDRLTAILGEQHDDVQRSLETTGPGVVSYHRVSRWGEWFTIRAPLISAGETTLTAERGARLPPRQERGDTLRNRDTDGGDGSGRDADARASGADDGSDDGSDLSGFLSAPARGAR